MIAIPMVAIDGVSPSVVHAGATAISAGEGHSMVLKRVLQTDGSVWTTGYNDLGALGDGTKVSRNSFVKVVSSGQCYTSG